MIGLILAILTSINFELPAAQVELGEPEAVWVPAGTEGVIVATPAFNGEVAFEVTGG